MANYSEGAADKSKHLDFDEVLKAEVAAGCRPPGKSLGLAFSGGGIRSATFNLGVIQALAKFQRLNRFDYLSTISGGGYIGGWLSMFIHRHAGGNVTSAEEELQKRKNDLEHPAIRFLRAYSNYLTPRLGLSADALTAVATYLRNLLLNLTVLFTLLGALLILPRISVLGEGFLVKWEGFDRWYWYPVILFCVLLPPASVVALNLFYKPAESKVRRPWYMRNFWLVGMIDLPVVLAAWIATCFYVHSVEKNLFDAGPWFVSVTVVYSVLWLAGVLIAKILLHPTDEHAKWHWAFVLFAVLAGATGGLILIGVAKALSLVPSDHLLWAAAAFAPPAIILTFTVMVTMHIGVMGHKFTEGDRELWSVFGGRLLALSSTWTVVFAIAIYGPALVKFTNQWVAGLGGGAWLASTLFGILAGKSNATAKHGAKPWVETLTKIAPYIFALGLLIMLSWGVNKALDQSYTMWRAQVTDTTVMGMSSSAEPGIYLHASSCPGTPLVTVQEIERKNLWHQFIVLASCEYKSLSRWLEPAWMLPTIFWIALLVALFMSWRVNINLFSLHHFYRNRLTRCYLGATNHNRRPHPLTGFDPKDDIPLSELARQKPLHILGTAINLNRGRQLAWQNRRAASFTFTPLHTGYWLASLQVRGGYQTTAEYGMDSDGIPIQLGTAIAISGAAASPNQGFHTSPPVAFLMTVFNVRLGRWCGDTARGTAWHQRDPQFGLRYWFAELFGTADQDYPFVSLSDGGHFENLGIYELVRRRCSVILASDAGADPKYAFDDLAEAMRKCYTDFGVDIQFLSNTNVDDIRPGPTDKLSARHYAIANIIYPGETTPGKLIYWKSSLTANMPADIMHYRRTHKSFPHETTADQFFDESQFESYRHLGYEVAMRSLNAMRERKELPEALL